MLPFFRPALPALCVLFSLLVLPKSLAEKKEKADPATASVKKSAKAPAKGREPAPRPAKGNERRKEEDKKAKGKSIPPAVEAERSGKKEPHSKEEEDTRKFHVVKAEPLSVKRTLPGLLESREESPVAMDLKRWSDMTVVHAVDHGSEVKKGDRLIELDTTALRKKIQELEDAMPLKELEFQGAELDLDKLEKSTPLSLESSSRSKIKAEEDLAYFEDVSRPLREKDAAQSIASAENNLSYASEELNQLKKMYEADDLVEETEEIILTRAENRVKEFEWALEQIRSRSERTLTSSLPREHEELKTAAEQQQINWRTNEKALRDALVKKRLEVEGKKRELEEARLALKEHREDLVEMTVTAPRDGIVYYGMSQRGKWITAATVDKKLLPGGKLSMREVVMTVVDPDKLQVRVATAEDKLKDLAPGQDATVRLKWNPKVELTGKVQSVSHIPFADNTYDTLVSLERRGEEPATYPGMNAEVEVLLHENPEALVIPAAAVQRKDGEERVTLKDGREKTIQTGHREEDKVEVTSGLRAGDEVALPEDGKNGKDADTDKKRTDGGKDENGKEEDPDNAEKKKKASA